MKFPSIKNEYTGKPDVMLTMSVFVIIICGIKFLFEGTSITVAEHILTLGHADALTYGALLTPVLGAHGYVRVRDKNSSQLKESEEAE